jgi:hypothetical protein
MSTTPMKRTIKTILLLVVLVWIVVFLVGRIRWPISLDQGWSSPVRVTDTEDADAGGGFLYKSRDTMLLLKEHYDWSAKSSTYSIMIRHNDPSNSWTQLPLSGITGRYVFYCPDLGQATDKLTFEQNFITNNQVIMSATFVRLNGDREVQIEPVRKWTADKKSLFGETGSNVQLKYGPFFGIGVLNDSDIYLPYSVRGETQRGKIIYDDEGPFNNGVFHSTDYGATWQMNRISADCDGGEPTMCKTKDYYYYFASKNSGFTLWFSRKPVAGGSWDEPKLLTKTSANWRGGGFLAEGDTVHACWLDSRLEKNRLDIGLIPAPHLFAKLGNCAVAYCQRKDSDSTWHKDIILSKGLRLSYWASMSVEGNKIVVAWDGWESRSSYDIYYATSKDGGKTWTRPLKVTDRAKDDITSERPQVALQNGVIHLFYAQGKWNRHEQASNQGGWPVYYQQRPFPD